VQQIRDTQWFFSVDPSFVFNAESLDLFLCGPQETSEIVSDGSGLTDILTELDRGVSEPAAQCRKQGLTRLVLMISETCNLRCSYCYADHGTYGGPEVLLKPSHAAQLYVDVHEHHRVVRNIQFFGGEPTLNTDAIRAVCRVAQDLAHDSEPPNFGVVTNGYRLSSDFYNLVEEYKIRVTVSIDGPERIHNLIRKTAGGANTHRETVKALKRLQAILGEANVGVECTLTKKHFEHNLTVRDIVEYFHQLGVPNPHVVPVSIDDNSPLSLKCIEDQTLKSYVEAAHWCFSKTLDGTPRFFTFLSGILTQLSENRPSKAICPAGVSTLCLGNGGMVYPCFMFYNDAEFCMGPIASVETTKQLGTFIDPVLKDSREECRQCWARGLCTSCIGAFHYASGSLWGTDDLYCHLNLELGKAALGLIAEVYASEKKWQRFVDALSSPAVVNFSDVV